MNRIGTLQPLAALLVLGIALVSPWALGSGANAQSPSSEASPSPTATPVWYGEPAPWVPTASPPIAAALVIKVHSLSVDCGGVSFITATVTDAAGRPVPNGTNVAFSADRGTIYPPISPTVGGSITVTYTAPMEPSPPVKFTATSGAVTSHAMLGLSCQWPPSPTPKPHHHHHQAPSIKPPSTGDGGLSGGGATGIMGIAIIVASTAGAIAVVRRRGAA